MCGGATVVLSGGFDTTTRIVSIDRGDHGGWIDTRSCRSDDANPVSIGTSGRTFLTVPDGPALATTVWATRPARRTRRAGDFAGQTAVASRDAKRAARGAATAETVKALILGRSAAGEGRVVIASETRRLAETRKPEKRKKLSLTRPHAGRGLVF